MTFQEALNKADKVWIAAKVGIPGMSYWTWIPTEKNAIKRFQRAVEEGDVKWDYIEKHNDLWVGQFMMLEEDN